MSKTSTRLLDFDSRYCDHWKAIAAFAHRSTNGRCCCCLLAASAQIHHACYQDERGAIAGREVPGLHIFPLCEECHDRSHRRDVWAKDRTDPVLGNHNTPEWVERLKTGYLLLSSGGI